MKRAGLYRRVSQDSHTTENQRRIVMEVAERSGWTVIELIQAAGFAGVNLNHTDTYSLLALTAPL